MFFTFFRHHPDSHVLCHGCRISGRSVFRRPWWFLGSFLSEFPLGGRLLEPLLRHAPWLKTALAARKWGDGAAPVAAVRKNLKAQGEGARVPSSESVLRNPEAQGATSLFEDRWMASAPLNMLLGFACIMDLGGGGFCVGDYSMVCGSCFVPHRALAMSFCPQVAPVCSWSHHRNDDSRPVSHGSSASGEQGAQQG